MISSENLKKLKIFQQMSLETLKKLSSVIEEKNFSDQKTIIKEGETTGSLFIVAKGTVSIQKKIDQKGKEVKSVAKVEVGEIFGEMAFLENQPHSATVVAMGEVSIYIISRKSLDDLFKKDAKLASEQVFALFSAVSSRLRSTTNELVTIYEVGRAVAESTSQQELVDRVMNRLETELGEKTTICFYQWNLYNNEYDCQSKRGPGAESLPSTIDENASLPKNEGNLIGSLINSNETKEGLFVYHREKNFAFDSGQRQMIETVSSVLAPALLGARVKEEEKAKERLMQGRSMGESI